MAPPAVSPAAAVKQWLRAANACGNSNTWGRVERCAWQASWPRKVANNGSSEVPGQRGQSLVRCGDLLVPQDPECPNRLLANHMSPQAWAFWPGSKAALVAYMITVLAAPSLLLNVCLDPQFLHGVSQDPENVVLQVLHCQNPFLVYPHRSSAYTHLSTKRPEIASHVLVQVPGQLQRKLPPLLGQNAQCLGLRQ